MANSDEAVGSSTERDEEHFGQAVPVSNPASGGRETCVESHLVSAWTSTINHLKSAITMPYRDVVGAGSQPSVSGSVMLEIHKNLEWLEEIEKTKLVETARFSVNRSRVDKGADFNSHLGG